MANVIKIKSLHENDMVGNWGPFVEAVSPPIIRTGARLHVDNPSVDVTSLDRLPCDLSNSPRDISRSNERKRHTTLSATGEIVFRFGSTVESVRTG